MTHEPLIGVIGGMGPYAGLDLTQKIFDHTAASSDADHVPVALLSYPGRIPDRTAFITGKTDVNPAGPIAEVAHELARLGVSVAGMPCHTAHAPPIFGPLQARLRDEIPHLRLLHMIEETIRFLREEYPSCRRIGVMATLGAYRTRLHADALEAAGLTPILPDENIQETIIHRAIYDPTYGLKAQSHPVSMIARQSLISAIEHLREKGADAVLLGCTELSLAFTEAEHDGLPIIDPTMILARALLRETYPHRLKPL
ncbi:MAG: aspartate/glutamate racemase family protein [Bacteroidetes bacterium]|nr:MAG: aspartate/glutamate racemase family protein [Bacteroidota bacterium]GIV58698.1 MAG: aspartate racemase [Rhodothermaceae bacterium]